MLGQKRNASLFAAPEAPLDTVVSVPVPSESIGGTRGELVPAREADSERIEPAFFAKNRPPHILCFSHRRMIPAISPMCAGRYRAISPPTIPAS